MHILLEKGNTCYMNSTLQCMRHMPELRESLVKINTNNPSVTTLFANGLKETWRNLDR